MAIAGMAAAAIRHHMTSCTDGPAVTVSQSVGQSVRPEWVGVLVLVQVGRMGLGGVLSRCSSRSSSSRCSSNINSSSSSRKKEVSRVSSKLSPPSIQRSSQGSIQCSIQCTMHRPIQNLQPALPPPTHTYSYYSLPYSLLPPSDSSYPCCLPRLIGVL